MATLSHEAFRRIVESFGSCDEYFTEMINAASLVNRGPFEKFYLLNGPCPEKIVWQLTGSDSAFLAKAAEIVCDRGGIGVDVNMGCSAPQIYRTGAGVAWMLKPPDEVAEAIKILRGTLDEKGAEKNQHFRLSVKCRLGDENFSEKSFFDFADCLAKNGVELISVHPRTMREKFRGLPKYDFAEKLALHFGKEIPVFVNGCMTDSAGVQSVLQKVPHASGIMIARGAAVRPWVFAEIEKNLFKKNCGKNETLKIDRQKVALDFIDNVEKFQPEEFLKTRIQRFFSYYCEQFFFAHYFKTSMLNFVSAEESRNRVKEYFLKQSGERFLEV